MGIEVEVAYALPEEQVVIPLVVEPPVTIADVVYQSGILKRFPQIELKEHMVGIFGRHLTLDHPVEAYDRVEIYRPLLMSPTDARRIRAESRRRQGHKT